MKDFCVLGSGIAGSTIAEILSKKYTVEVFDKARGPGGRTSNKRYKSNLSFDHGRQYFNPKTKEFKKLIHKLCKKKILKVWEGNHLDFSLKKSDNNPKYIGRKANNDICKYQLKNIKQNYLSCIKRINYKKKTWEVTLKNNFTYKFKGLIITCPYPQLKKLCRKFLKKNMLNLNIRMQPNITLMIAMKNNKNSRLSSIKFNDDILAWGSNENSKNKFKSNINLWTLQSSLAWAKKNIRKYRSDNKCIEKLLLRFLQIMGLKKENVIFQKAHGWLYSYSYTQTKIKSYWDNKCRLGVCGDWLLGPKAEDAWISASALSKRIK